MAPNTPLQAYKNFNAEPRKQVLKRNLKRFVYFMLLESEDARRLSHQAQIHLFSGLLRDRSGIIPTWITGPFICSHCPDSVYVSMALILDDVARAHIHLFECPEVKGRYICSAVEITIEELCEFISTRYPEHQMPTPDSWKDIVPVKFSGFSTKKLQEIGFKYENGLAEMFDGAIRCCKEKGLL
ncbi:UNVERIFIED_CONTAM: protein BRI1-5 ENHANCED 1 [Sesamum latifolium]|uniref:Protein BRI1-5 ENHANCED 1 n=1 Tax=Sesamum latifolium TaxID=2727402 RepID=A0AAW2YG83_9LAMI